MNRPAMTLTLEPARPTDGPLATVLDALERVVKDAEASPDRRLSAATLDQARLALGDRE